MLLFRRSGEGKAFSNSANMFSSIKWKEIKEKSVLCSFHYSAFILSLLFIAFLLILYAVISMVGVEGLSNSNTTFLSIQWKERKPSPFCVRFIISLTFSSWFSKYRCDYLMISMLWLGEHLSNPINTMLSTIKWKEKTKSLALGMV